MTAILVILLIFVLVMGGLRFWDQHIQDISLRDLLSTMGWLVWGSVVVILLATLFWWLRRKSAKSASSGEYSGMDTPSRDY